MSKEMAIINRTGQLCYIATKRKTDMGGGFDYTITDKTGVLVYNGDYSLWPESLLTIVEVSERIVIRHPSFADQSEIDTQKGGPENRIETIEDAEEAIKNACRHKDTMTDENKEYWTKQLDRYSIVKITHIEEVIREPKIKAE